MSTIAIHDQSNTTTTGVPPVPPEAHQIANDFECNKSLGLRATYSPEDNKLRLYSSKRFDDSLKDVIKRAGFIWAPKQALWVAPMWTPARETLLLGLCDEIGDEDTSLVARAEERADRFGDYQGKRVQDAEAAHRTVADVSRRFEFGQPILVGHHSERKARKDAERMENSMRKAVNMWETAEYWKQRAAGALSHAKYKERADVRYRRIQKMEAEKRKAEKEIKQMETAVQAWSAEGLTMERALQIADLSGGFYRCFTLTEYPREAPASQYEGQMSLYSALSGGVITAEQAKEICLRSYPRSITHYGRWVAHYANRIAYERAMIDEKGGLVAEQHAIEVGGSVRVRFGWGVVKRINKSKGEIKSLTVVHSDFVRVAGIEEVKEYLAPTNEQQEEAQTALKKGKLCNYPGEGFACLTQEEYTKISKGYKAFREVAAKDGNAKHRARFALGVFALPAERDTNRRHHFVQVFITDAKRTDLEKVSEEVTAPTVADLAPVPELVTEPVAGVVQRTSYKAPEPNKFDALKEALKQGVQVVSAPQLFPTSPELAARAVDRADVKIGCRLLEPNAGTGELLRALPGVLPFGENRQTVAEVVAVEINHALADGLRRSGLASTVIHQDFLECGDELGTFDVVLMNPPFENGADIRHIEHALRFLKSGGRMVAICADGPRQSAKLRPMVEAAGGTWEPLPSGTFEGTGVRSVLMAFTKP